MRRLRAVLMVGLVLLVGLGSLVRVHSAPNGAKPSSAPDLSGLHAFDLRVGHWQVHNRRLKERLMGSHQWEEFDGTQTWWKTMDGYGNADDNVLNLPDGVYRGVSVRAYDPATGQWALWWLDARHPLEQMDAPNIGRFKDGVGTFYADYSLRGKPVTTRYIWSRITRDSAHWEQAFSPDRGKTWETNWISEFHRIP